MRPCLFCDDKASTVEDAFPLWLLARFPTPNGVSVEMERGGESLPTRKARRHELRVRCVCADCNSGWMSRLEGRTKPIIERLLSMSSLVLPEHEQVVLAEWTLKTAMVFEALRKEPPSFYRQEERAALRKDSAFPPRTGVWLAKCVDIPGIYGTASDLFESRNQLPTEGRLFVTTMAFGTMALQVATGRAPVNIAPSTVMNISERPGPWAETAARIWQASDPVSWPLRYGLNGEKGLDEFTARLRPPQDDTAV